MTLQRTTVSQAVLALMASYAATPAHAQATDAEATPDAGNDDTLLAQTDVGTEELSDEDRTKLGDITVTSGKVRQSIQEVPITVNAIDRQRMDDLGIDDFADYVQYLPNITRGGRGPGQNEVYIRGTAIQAINTTIAEANGSAPNVGIYLDEQPVTAGGRNLDVYTADMERIEVLPGPQGTLYGASSMAGTVRLITKKPELDLFEARFKASSAFTQNGDPSNSTEAVLNLPIIDGKMAMRGVIFNDNRGGYIDNVQGTFTPDPSKNPALPSTAGITFTPAGGDPQGHQFADGSFAEPGRVYPVEYAQTTNDDLAEDDFNDANYHGFRLSGKYQFDNGFSLLLSHHNQTIEADGVFDYDPEVGDLEVQRFNAEELEDRFSQTAWTLEGRLGALEMIYTGAYLSRDVEQTIDYSNYVNNGAYIAGYVCEYNTPGYHGGGGVGYTFDPTLSGRPGVIECSRGDSFAAISNENTRMTHEFRIRGDAAEWIHYTTGIFYEDAETRHVGDFNYGNPSFNPVDPSQLQPLDANDRSVRSPRTQFTNDITRPEEQLALFGEVTFDLSDTVSVTGGARFYDIEVGFEGFSGWKYGNRPVPNLANGNNANGVVLEADGDNTDGTSLTPDITGGRDYTQEIADAGVSQPFSADDVILKGSVHWKPNRDLLLYATWSEGFRPPGFNRAAARNGLEIGADGVASAPSINADYRIPLIYQSDELNNMELGWKTTLLDGKLRFNGALYRIDWTDIQVSHFDAQNISNLWIVDNAGDAEITGLEGDFTWRATQDLTIFGAYSFNDTELVGLNPAFSFATAPVGSSLPLAPETQFNLGARYEWYTSKGLAYAQLVNTYASEAFSSLIAVNREEQDAYFISDAAVGLSALSWGVEFFVSNLTDERAELHINTLDQQRRITTNRPLTAGLRVKYNFSE